MYTVKKLFIRFTFKAMVCKDLTQKMSSNIDFKNRV